jgi:hypothetical protein
MIPVPVRKPYPYENQTGLKIVPELVRKIDSNVSLTNHKRLTGENIIFSHVKTTLEKPVDTLKLARMLNGLGLRGSSFYQPDP